MKSKRNLHHAIRRKTSGITRDYAENEKHRAWWEETVRMVDAGFRNFFENAGLPIPQVSEHYAETPFSFDNFLVSATVHSRTRGQHNH